MLRQELICLSSDEDEPQAKKSKVTTELVETTDVASKDNESFSVDSAKAVKHSNGTVICIDSEESDSEESGSEEIVDLKMEKIEHNGLCMKSDENIEQETQINSPQNTSTVGTVENCEEVSQTSETKNQVITPEVSLESASPPEEVLKEPSITSVKDPFSTIDSLPTEAKNFLSVCKQQLEKTSCADVIFKKVPILIKMFIELENELYKSEYLKNFLNKQTKIAKGSVNGCIVSFKDVYQHLKLSLDSEGIELSKKHRKHVRKLEEVIRKLLEKLEELDSAEVDFDADENDTSYMKADRYTRRLSAVYKKYCQILKRNPHAGRITHERLDFVSSNYNEINLAICKKYKNNRIFPSYDELLAYIQETVQLNNLQLSPAEMKYESEMCFKQLGELLQMRRKKELYESHCSYIIEQQDPAENSKDLEMKLRISSKEGQMKIDQVYQEFTRQQELGLPDEEIECSDKSDDSEDQQTNLSSDSSS